NLRFITNPPGRSIITACKNVLYRFKQKKWLVLIRPLLAGFDSAADSTAELQSFLKCLLCEVSGQNVERPFLHDGTE
ncbi:MAG: hypothetical protein WAK31_27815, partial [Chthoniobacterales bacterium]